MLLLFDRYYSIVVVVAHVISVVGVVVVVVFVVRGAGVSCC